MDDLTPSLARRFATHRVSCRNGERGAHNPQVDLLELSRLRGAALERLNLDDERWSKVKTIVADVLASTAAERSSVVDRLRTGRH